jgi:hypothetical protein
MGLLKEMKKNFHLKFNETSPKKFDLKPTLKTETIIL